MEEKEWHEDIEFDYFEGNIDELSQLLQQKKKPQQLNKLAICHMCSLSMATKILVSLEGNLMVIHGPTGCANIQATTTGLRFSTSTSRSILTDRFQETVKVPYIPRVVCTGLGEKEVIMGGEEKLARTILEADSRLNPKLITVLTTCSTHIIGDDLQRVAEEVKDKIKAKIITLNTHGLARHRFGYYGVYKALIDALVEENKEKITGSVNVLADQRRTGSEINHKEIFRVFNKLGVKLNLRFVRNISVDHIKDLTRAELNIMTCFNSGYETAQYLKERFGMPFIEKDYPIGLEASRKWYHEVIDTLGIKDKENIIDREFEGAKKRIERAERILRGKTIACIGGQGRITRYLDLIHELGMEPIYISAYQEMTVRGIKILEEKIRGYGWNPHILIQLGFFDDEAAMEKFKPDVMFGDPSAALYAYRSGVGFTHLEQAPQVGFNGSVNVANRWADAIEAPVFKFWNRYYEMPSHGWKGYGMLKFGGGCPSESF